ncbi:MAG TPA: YdjY domain-containing protein [Syntrophorhabdaceae bacterium]|jgi:hypothetical protein
MDRRTFLWIVAGGIWLAAIPSGTGHGEPFADDKKAAPSRERPLITGRDGKSLHIYTETNGRRFGTANPHWGVVYKDGELADKAILKAFCTPLAFHDGLVQIGARPGNDLAAGSEGSSTTGERLIVTASLPGVGDEIPLGRIFRDSGGKDFVIRFGGNRKAAREEGTGCIMCLESCWVGITSNAAYPLISGFRRFMRPNSSFKGNTELLSASESQPVILTYRPA